MGLVYATTGAIRGSLSEQWLEVFEADMDSTTLFCEGVKTRKGENVHGASNVISNGSIIHVYENQFMMILDGGRIVDYTSEPGYYRVDSGVESVFSGDVSTVIKDTIGRVKFGGETSRKQKVYYVNLQEIKGIKFGTKHPINYFDNFYNAELFLRACGNYSIKITDPLKFYKEVVPKNAKTVDIEDINEQYLSEFLEALQTAIGKLSVEGHRISHIQAKGKELSEHMQVVLDKDWNDLRGMEIQSVGIASVSYDDESQKLINMRNQGAMLSDPTIREGYVQGAVARGMEAAGSNENGAMNAFMGMGVGMQSLGGAVGSMSNANIRQMHEQESFKMQRDDSRTSLFKSEEWKCICGTVNDGKYCSNCGAKKLVKWRCQCGALNSGKFCNNCGKEFEMSEWKCKCGKVNNGNFCSDCGRGRS